MKLRRSSEQRRIFFPWESRGGVLRRLRAGRIRPLIIGLLVIGFVVVVGVRERRRAGVRHTRAALLDTRRAVDGYMAAHDGGCPADLNAVVDFATLEQTPRDAWGRPLRLVCPARTEDVDYELSSDGPDGKPGGLDRIQ